MSDLIAIGYPDEQTAELAADEARRLAKDLIIGPDTITSIARDKDDKLHALNNAHPGGADLGNVLGAAVPLSLLHPVLRPGHRSRDRRPDGEDYQVRDRPRVPGP